MIDTAELKRAVADEFACSLDGVEPSRLESDLKFADWHTISKVVARLTNISRVKVIAISGSQGSGKSTLAEILCDHLQDLGVAAYTCSLDDFYLTQDQRGQLARDVHPLLQTRGVPGTP